MLTVKKIRGIARVKRAGLETFKGSENGARPFPAVAEQVLNTEGAVAGWVRPDGRGIPVAKIEIAMQFGWRRVTPGKTAFPCAFWRAVGSAMKLLLARQAASEPFGIGRGFRLAHVDGPFHGQANVAEHGAVVPKASVAHPKRGMRDPILLLPSPIVGRPESGIVVAASLHEAQEIAVANVVGVDGKFRNFPDVRIKLVVPAKF